MGTSGHVKVHTPQPGTGDPQRAGHCHLCPFPMSSWVQATVISLNSALSHHHTFVHAVTRSPSSLFRSSRPFKTCQVLSLSTLKTGPGPHFSAPRQPSTDRRALEHRLWDQSAGLGPTATTDQQCDLGQVTSLLWTPVSSPPTHLTLQRWG